MHLNVNQNRICHEGNQDKFENCSGGQKIDKLIEELDWVIEENITPKYCEILQF